MHHTIESTPYCELYVGHFIRSYMLYVSPSLQVLAQLYRLSIIYIQCFLPFQQIHMKNSKHAPHNRNYAILYIVIIKVCSNTYILFVFFGIVRLANGKSPLPKKNQKNLRHLPLGVGDKISFLMWQKKGPDLCCPRYIPKISCRLGSLLSRVQKVYTCNYLL